MYMILRRDAFCRDIPVLGTAIIINLAFLLLGS